MRGFFRKLALIFLIILISPIVSVSLYFIGNMVMFMLTNHVFFPIEEEYLFTYDSQFDCSEAENEKLRVKKICEAMGWLKTEIKNAKATKNLGVFEKKFQDFAKGDKSIKFYYSKNLNKSAVDVIEDSKLDSLKARAMLYLFQNSVYKSIAYAVIWRNKIVIGDSFLNSDLISRASTLTHEILHLCWAAEWEVDFLTGQRGDL